MIQVVEVTKSIEAARADGQGLVERFNALTGAQAVAMWQTRIFFLEDINDVAALNEVCRQLLCDDVIETASQLTLEARQTAVHETSYIGISAPGRNGFCC